MRTMLALATSRGQTPMPLTQIAEREKISLAYLEQLIAALRRRGLVASVRGARGGYRLALPPERITLGDVLRAAEEPIGPVDCVDSARKGECCDRERDCAARPAWERLHTTMASVLDATTLAELSASGAVMQAEAVGATEGNKGDRRSPLQARQGLVEEDRIG